MNDHIIIKHQHFPKIWLDYAKTPILFLQNKLSLNKAILSLGTAKLSLKSKIFLKYDKIILKRQYCP
jgi:hypothetical protein